MRKSLILFLLLFMTLPCGAQRKTQIVKDFTPVCDTLSVRMEERTGVKCLLRLSQVMKRGAYLDFYFNASLSNVPLRPEDCTWLRNELQSLFPEEYAGQKVGEIYSVKEKMTDLAVTPLNFDGTAMNLKYRTVSPRGQTIVTSLDRPEFDDGLSGRHIALWPSHGLYYDRAAGKWRWQRPVLFQTVEDLFSTSFVLPYLVPMLENAGAYVMMPRERDVSPVEMIVDNDYSGTTRASGSYIETGAWSDAGEGFADTQEIYAGTENPFTLGTARSAAGVFAPAGIGTGSREDLSSLRGYARAVWTPDVPERGSYAVYVSYKTVPDSATDARYTVHHLGGTSSFTVNQAMGGGTWIYLGTFEFDRGKAGSVEMDNVSLSGGTVTADAVKIGGGVGNIAGIMTNDPYAEAETSGMPRYAEAARYWLQWAGMPDTVYSQYDFKNDYRDDLYSRGDWVDLMSGGSVTNPKVEGRAVPVDVTLAFHTDAGVTLSDTVIGTLAIYTRTNQWRLALPDGEDRRTIREFADIVQSQIVNDIQASADPAWQRRQIWNQGYRETRTPPSPAIITESLSHQNLADMRYGLDPAFKFTLCRAIYKGILKYLSGRYGCSYTVQPLPVRSFAAVPVGSGTVRLSWLPRVDSIESTAVAKEYMLYTRVNDGAFDGGVKVSTDMSIEGRVYTDVSVEPGKIYSYKITALNEGGESFPSEILAVGIPDGGSFGDKYVAVVNDFTRVSGPVWYDSAEYAGFNNLVDSGVPYIRDIAYTGEIYNNRRSSEWQTDDNSGFGASFNDHSGCPVAGNTFDFVYRHGKAVLAAGVPFCSMSAEAFAASGGQVQASALDIICGKQVTTICGGKCGAYKYEVFPEAFQKAISAYVSAGGDILVSGSHIGTDIWDRVYPIEKDESVRTRSVKFAENVLGYRWTGNNAGHSGVVRPVHRASGSFSDTAAGVSKSAPSAAAFSCNVSNLKFNTELCETMYKVEGPDGLNPAGADAVTIFRYADTNQSAGVSYVAKDGHRAVSFGFPLETVVSDGGLDGLIASTLRFFGL